MVVLVEFSFITVNICALPAHPGFNILRIGFNILCSSALCELIGFITRGGTKGFSDAVARPQIDQWCENSSLMAAGSANS